MEDQIRTWKRRKY